MTTIEKSPLSRVEQELLKEWMWGIFDEIAYIILDSKEKIKLVEGKDDKPDTYRFRFIFQTKDGKLYKLIRLLNIDIMSNLNYDFNLNFSMEIGRKYTKVELFDYDLFSRYE